MLATRYMKDQLYSVHSYDPMSLVIAVVVLGFSGCRWIYSCAAGGEY